MDLGADEIDKTAIFRREHLRFGTFKGYDLVRYTHSAFTNEVGNPTLPCIPLSVLIPQHATAIEVEVVSFKRDKIDGTYNVFPTQPPKPISYNQNSYEFVPPNLNGGSNLYCLNHDETVCWTITLQNDIHDVSIGDIDCDSCLEVAVGTAYSSYVYVLDDPANTSGCSPVGVDEKEETRIKSLELKVMKDEIVFSIPSSGVVSLKLYDICGRLSDCLIESYIAKGSHSVNLPNLGSGIYFVVLTYNGAKLTDKLVVIK